ncbi:MAG TPA: hypothetical protein VFO15_01335 [Xanthobacteraceae bacterium]|nr:hypothetical protein [Xanthobacteraceae bacterium]
MRPPEGGRTLFRPARAGGRFAALAFLKLHGVISCISLFFLQTRETRLAWAHARRRNKKPGAASRPGVSRSFAEYAFLEDSRYTSQQENGFRDAGPKTQHPQGIATTPP